MYQKLIDMGSLSSIETAYEDVYEVVKFKLDTCTWTLRNPTVVFGKLGIIINDCFLCPYTWESGVEAMKEYLEEPIRKEDTPTVTEDGNYVFI